MSDPDSRVLGHDIWGTNIPNARSETNSNNGILGRSSYAGDDAQIKGVFFDSDRSLPTTCIALDKVQYYIKAPFILLRLTIICSIFASNEKE